MEHLDQIAFSFIHAIAGRSSLGDAALIFLASVLPYLLGIGFFLLLTDVHGFRARLFYFAQAALAIILARGILVELIAHFFYRARPFITLGFSPLISESSSSMPSGHAAFFFALTLVIWYMNRRWGMIYFISATVVVLARVACGVHWPSDVLAGMAVGVLSAYLVHELLLPHAVFGRYNRESAREDMVEHPVINKEN